MTVRLIDAVVVAALAFAPACLDDSAGNGAEGEGETEPVDRWVLPEVATATPDAASFVTWNLKTFPLTNRAPQFLSDALENWQDDVVAVQEIVDADAFVGAVEAVPGYAAVLNDDAEQWLRLGLIYNTDRVHVSDVQTLFKSDSYAFPRPPLRVDLAVQLDEGAPAIDFTVLVVHLKSQIGSNTGERRRAAALALDQWIEAHAGVDADRDVIVLGDFNERLVASGAGNSFEVFLTEPSAYSFLTYELDAQAGYSQLSFRSFLDHILFTDDALDEYGSGATAVLDAVVIEPGYQETVSDHLPVRSTFEPHRPYRTD